MKTRKPAVAGAFYPYSKQAVLDQLKALYDYWGVDLEKAKRKDCLGVVVPHAGYQYSGYVAAKVYSTIPKADTFIIFGPNHYGTGANVGVFDEGVWETPLGEVEVDADLAGDILENSRFAESDNWAHEREHSIEVQVPFLQTAVDGFKIVPITIKHYAPDKDFLDVCEDLGAAVAKAVKGSKKKIVLIASTDFTHYEPQSVAEKKDSLAMDEIINLDEKGLFDVVSKNNISMCGYAGVAIVIVACKKLGAKKVEKVAYMTSGDVIGDKSAVVGYGGLRIL